MNKNLVGKEVIYPDLSYKIMQAVFEVHNHLGSGFSEEIYEKALALEFKAQGIPFEHQKQIQVHYKGQFIGNYRLDMVVDDKIILELKAVSELNDVFQVQLHSYLAATGLQLGILINFGSKRVKSFRIPNLPDYSTTHSMR